jgi:predicted DNA-binding transcriptional regulator AlpA
LPERRLAAARRREGWPRHSAGTNSGLLRAFYSPPPDKKPVWPLHPSPGLASSRLLTAAAVAEMLGFAPATILDWFEAGRLRGFKLGHAVRFREPEVAGVG